jgi:Flp pilus assembly pilin Flp
VPGRLNQLSRTLARIRDERGAALVEYSLILGFVVIAAVGVALLIGGFVSQDISNTARGFGP